LNIAQNGSFGFAKHWLVYRTKPYVPIVLCEKKHSFANFGLCIGLCGLQMCMALGWGNFSFW
jgi:hypothetical protein